MRSLWQQKVTLPSFEPLRGDISADVLIIGGGLAGLLTAFLLKSKGIDCVLLEKERILNGTTANTTAKITPQHGLIYHKILKAYGKSFAKAYYIANLEARERLINLCHRFSCNVELKDNFVYSKDKFELESEFEALEALGASPLFKEDVPLPFIVSGAVGLKDQAQFNPLDLCSHLIKHLRIYENSWVREMIGTTAVTDFGKVKAKKVVVATHFPFINKHGSYFLKLYQHRSYILALENVGRLNEMYVDNDKKGLSFSSFGDILLLGGGGHRTGKKGGSFGELETFRIMHYPHSKEVSRFSAQDTMSLDDIPYIGNYSGNTPDMYVATGFNKWGMTGSMLSAEIISGEMSGERKAYAQVFSPSRSILKPQLLINGFETVVNLITPTLKRCPHLGCALKYNPYEHSWDCPCHGSRFDEMGKVLENPANGDLKS